MGSKWLFVLAVVHPRFATIGYILPEYWRFPGYLSKFLESKQNHLGEGEVWMPPMFLLNLA